METTRDILVRLMGECVVQDELEMKTQGRVSLTIRQVMD